MHRIPGGEIRQIYPLIYHELESAIFDAVLQAIAVFVEHSTPDGDGDGVPGGRPHHRSLGRSRYVEAATKADDALSRISRSFDFLLGVSPINSVEAYQRFEEKVARKPRISATARCRSTRTRPSAGCIGSTCARSKTLCWKNSSARSNWNWTSS